MVKLELERLQEYCNSVLKLEVTKYTLEHADKTAQESLERSVPVKEVIIPPKEISCDKPREPSFPIKKKQSYKRLIIFAIAFLWFATLIILASIFDYGVFLIIFSLLFLIFSGVVLVQEISELIYDKNEFEHDVNVYESELLKFKNEQVTYTDRARICELRNKELHELFIHNQFEKDSEYETHIHAHRNLRDEASQITSLLRETALQLEKLYDKDVIFAKYRNLVAMSAICEYLSSGRCDKLEGMGGAYNLYEEEIRLNLVITQISKVIEHLDQVKENQFLLYSQVTAANAQLNRMADDIENMLHQVRELKVNSDLNLHFSAINAYCSQVTAENAKLLSRLVFTGFITQ